MSRILPPLLVRCMLSRFVSLLPGCILKNHIGRLLRNGIHRRLYMRSYLQRHDAGIYYSQALDAKNLQPLIYDSSSNSRVAAQGACANSMHRHTGVVNDPFPHGFVVTIKAGRGVNKLFHNAAHMWRKEDLPSKAG